MLPLLKNQIDITHVPFSNRGSRILVYQHVNRPSFFSEYYDSLDGIAPPSSIPAFGWTSAVFIDLAIQASRTQAEKDRSVKHEG